MVDPGLLIHPGDVLREDFLVPHGLTASELAGRLGLPANRITRLVNGQTSVSHETAVLLGVAFGTTAEFWLNLQVKHDLDAGIGGVSGDRLERAHHLHDELMSA